jgi:hypothetical protein
MGGVVNLVHFECGLKVLCITYLYTYYIKSIHTLKKIIFDDLPLLQFLMRENTTKENKGVSTKIMKWAVGPCTLALIV